MKKISVLILTIFLSNVLFSQTNTFAPDFRLKEHSTGKSISLGSLLDGKTIVILSFFDTKCEPCKKELPQLENISKKFTDSIKIFLISLDDKPEKVLPDFIKEYKIGLPVLLDPLGYLAGEKYGVTKYGRAEVPQLFVVGKDGKIKKHLKGYHPDLEEILAKTIAQLKSEKVSLPQKNSIKIIYTNSANGYLESCDCPENPFGGLVRRVTAIKNLKEKYPDAILVDSGDTFPPRENKLLTEYCIKIMQFVNYDFCAIGDQELINGLEYLKSNITKLPFYSANLQTCDENMCYPLTEPYLIKNLKWIKIAIISIIDKKVFALFPKSKLKKITILDHKECLTKIIPELRSKEQVELIVLLSHSGLDEDKQIAKEIPGIDIIVGGHSQSLTVQPVKVNSTIIVQAGENGHRVGILELEVDENKKISSYKNEFVLLDKTIPDHPQSRELITEYNELLKKQAEKFLSK